MLHQQQQFVRWRRCIQSAAIKSYYPRGSVNGAAAVTNVGTWTRRACGEGQRHRQMQCSVNTHKHTQLSVLHRSRKRAKHFARSFNVSHYHSFADKEKPLCSTFTHPHMKTHTNECVRFIALELRLWWESSMTYLASARYRPLLPPFISSFFWFQFLAVDFAGCEATRGPSSNDSQVHWPETLKGQRACIHLHCSATLL